MFGGPEHDFCVWCAAKADLPVLHFLRVLSWRSVCPKPTVTLNPAPDCAPLRVQGKLATKATPPQAL